jgi:ABC-2 type transport system ATP-binding protein
VSGSRTVIKVEELLKVYNGEAVPAVNKISFQIDNGDVFGILGPNGAGKTTTLSIICGLRHQTSGTVSVDGLTHQHDHLAIKKIIGVVPQDIALYPTLTAFENLKYFGNLYGLKGDSLKKSILGYLDEFGLKDAAHKRVGNFSGGMKRRVNLIAGILHNPKIIFLDEPTVGVDVQSRNMISEFLKALNKQGTTIVYTSHHMEEAQNLCNRIVVIDHGMIIAKGKPAELISSYQCGNLEELFLKLTGRSVRD